MAINADTQTVGDIVREDFRTAAVFQEFGIDFCCGGGVSLAAACDKHQIPAETLTQRLEQVTAAHDPSVPAFNTWQPDVLIEHIVSTHHQYVRRMLPVISAHADKVAMVHGERHPETKRIADLFQAVRDELEHHMFKEEQVLFPYIVAMVRASRGEGAATPGHFGSVRNPIRMMEAEHENAGGVLAAIRAAGDNLTPPADACETYRVLYAELDAFERDLHQHIHLENNILHPRAIALEEALLAEAA